MQLGCPKSQQNPCSQEIQRPRPKFSQRIFHFPGVPLKFPQISPKSQGICRNAGGNRILCDMPGAVSSLTKLIHLTFNANDLQGGIPEEVGSLASLKYLDISNNELRGTIPEAAASLANLTTFVLRFNGVRGAIPIALASSTKLTALHLSSNKFKGAFPLDSPSLATCGGVQEREAIGSRQQQS